MHRELDGRRAVITGGSRGIGAATAKAFAEAGAHVAIVARSAEKLAETALEIVRVSDRPPVVVAADLSTAEGVESSIRHCIEQLDGIDVLVNNAGSSGFGTVEEMRDEEWLEAINLKLMGYIRCMRVVLPHMRLQRWGRIINIGGVGGLLALPKYSAGLVNAAVDHLSRTTAGLVGPDGVLVTCIHPGLIATDRAQQVHDAGTAVAPFPIAREGTAEEVAELVMYLASDAASFITGSAIVIDGGATLSLDRSDKY